MADITLTSAIRASLMDGLKDNISGAIQAVRAADKGVTGILGAIGSRRGILTRARSALDDTTTSATTPGAGAPAKPAPWR